MQLGCAEHEEAARQEVQWRRTPQRWPLRRLPECWQAAARDGWAASGEETTVARPHHDGHSTRSRTRPLTHCCHTRAAKPGLPSRIRPSLRWSVTCHCTLNRHCWHSLQETGGTEWRGGGTMAA